MFQVNNVCVVNISGSSNAALKPEFDLWQNFCFIHVQMLYFCILLAVVTSFKFDESYQLRFGEVWTEERGRRLASGRVTTVRATPCYTGGQHCSISCDWLLVRPSEFIGSEITPAPSWIISDQRNLPYRSGKHVNMSGQNKSHQPGYRSLHSSLGCGS